MRSRSAANERVMDEARKMQEDGWCRADKVDWRGGARPSQPPQGEVLGGLQAAGGPFQRLSRQLKWTQREITFLARVVGPKGR